MKKSVFLFLCLACALTFAACGTMADPIALPPAEEITAMDITAGGETASHTDAAWIGEVLAGISAAEPTRRESVQDAPQVDEYIQIDLHSNTETSTLFAYAEGEKCYIEQPYQGIYQIDHQLYDQLQEAG